MPRPSDVRNDSLVNAADLAATGSRLERTYSSSDLPRLAEAGVLGASTLQASFRFSQYEGHPAVDGTLVGRVSLTCQRCMGTVEIEIDERFGVLIVGADRADEPGGYEPIVADTARLDLRWLVEDQALLALPLVARHADERCGELNEEPVEREASARNVQRPFQNLRDMMRKR